MKSKYMFCSNATKNFIFSGFFQQNYIKIGIIY